MNDRQNPMQILADRMPVVGTAQVAIAVARAQLNSALPAFAKIEQVAHSARNDRTLTEAGQRVAAGKAVKRLADQHERNLAQAEEGLATELEAVETRLRAVERPSLDDAWLTPIIAQHLLGLPATERIKLLGLVHKDGDITPLRVMVSLPTTITGLPRDRLDYARGFLHQAMAPDDLEHKEKLHQSVEIISGARRMLSAAVDKHYTQDVKSLIHMAQAAEAT